MTLTLALSYGSREELINTIKEISNKVKNNIISPEKIDESIINKHLYTQNLPDVDLLIRTSGEQRISNFLLWQIAYAELYFTNTLWPDFKKKICMMLLLNIKKENDDLGKQVNNLANILLLKTYIKHCFTALIIIIAVLIFKLKTLLITLVKNTF